MKHRTPLPTLTALLALMFALPVLTLAKTQESPQAWYQSGQQRLKELKQHASNKRAKNVILFVGDGMGVSTVTAARILAGQLNGLSGEEHQLSFETFPHLALAKTYNTNQQTPDSAGTMTAMMTGVKTKAGVISVDQRVRRGDCASQPGTELTTVLELAEIIGLATGIVTTTRITHATPAATYAHTIERNFESDAAARFIKTPTNCIDIAAQLIGFEERFSQDFPWVDGPEVILGGGQRSFLPKTNGDSGAAVRRDQRNLIKEWRGDNVRSRVVANATELATLDPDQTDRVLGLFTPSHMAFEIDRPANEPSLSDMTAKAIELLSNNEQGFFLMVEAGRIDHAHHAGNAARALHDTIELSRAVTRAVALTRPEETLIMVTADHSHVFTIAGYPTRGNPILGHVVGNDARGDALSKPSLALDDKPYTTLGYSNGLGGGQIWPLAQAARRPAKGGRQMHAEIDPTDVDYYQQSLVPLSSESHGGEDVAVYAVGPGAELVRGSLEQHVIFHIIDEALQLSKRAGKKGWRGRFQTD